MKTKTPNTHTHTQPETQIVFVTILFTVQYNLFIADYRWHADQIDVNMLIRMSIKVNIYTIYFSLDFSIWMEFKLGKASNWMPIRMSDLSSGNGSKKKIKNKNRTQIHKRILICNICLGIMTLLYFSPIFFVFFYLCLSG